jgi:hypothetical protein
MSLRCKPGDVCLIIGADYPPAKAYIGHVVRVVRLYDGSVERVVRMRCYWITDPEMHPEKGCRLIWHDEHLLPLPSAQSVLEHDVANLKLIEYKDAITAKSPARAGS